MIVETGARRRTFNLLGFAKNIMSYEAYGSPAAPVNFQRAMESNSTHNQTSPPPSQLPNFGRSFISALRRLLAPDPANLNVPTGR